MLPLQVGVPGQECRNIDVGNPVPVGDHESTRMNMIFTEEEPACGFGFNAGLRETDLPVLTWCGYLRGGEGKRECLCEGVAVQEIIGDHLALVAQGQDEPGMMVVGITFHDVPEHRVFTELDERFRHLPCLL